MNIFVFAILFYLLYRFIAGFLIPVIRTTSHVRRQFNDMNQQQDSSTPNAQRPGNAQRPTPNAEREGSSSGASKVGEYIDFEEVK